MKTIACAALILLAGCAREPGPGPAPSVPPKSPPSKAPPQEATQKQAPDSTAKENPHANCCFGMHLYNPPSKCRKCGTGGQPTDHKYCASCADQLGLCLHCGKPVEPGDIKKKEVPPREPPPPKQDPPPPKEDPPKAGRDGELPSFAVKQGSVANPRHPLIAFVCRMEDFEAQRSARLEKEGDPAPAPLKATDEQVLFVVWGKNQGWPEAKAIFDRKSGRGRVDAQWTGAPGMKESKDMLYAGYGFKLGRLEPGDYVIDVYETTAVEPDKPKLTKTISIRVER